MPVRCAAAAGILLSLLSTAGAEPICVACAAPEAAYPCALSSDSKIQQATDDPRAVEAVCLKVLKKTGQHASCRVVPKETAGCDGAVHVIADKDYWAALTDAGTSTKVEGLLPGAARVTGESLGKAGAAISGSAKSTWSCVTSLFTNC